MRRNEGKTKTGTALAVPESPACASEMSCRTGSDPSASVLRSFVVGGAPALRRPRLLLGVVDEGLDLHLDDAVDDETLLVVLEDALRDGRIGVRAFVLPVDGTYPEDRLHVGEVHVGQFAFPAARGDGREGGRVGEAASRLRGDVGRWQVGGDEVAADLVLLKLLQFLVKLPLKLLHERDEFRYVFAELDLDGIGRAGVEGGKREAWRLRSEDGAEEHVERTHGRVDFASAGRQHGGDLFQRPLEDPYRGEYPDDAILAETRRL